MEVNGSQKYFPTITFSCVKQFSFKVITEIVSIFAAKKFLEQIGQLFRDSKKISQDKIYSTIVVAPVWEEFLFRGVLLATFWLLQKGLQKLDVMASTEEDKKTQRVARVYFCAYIFAISHVLNDHKYKIHILLQCTSCYLLGISAGYLVEKYHRISIGILFHGIHNSLCVWSVHKQSDFIFVGVLIVVNHLFFLALVATKLDEKILSRLQRFKWTIL